MSTNKERFKKSFKHFAWGFLCGLVWFATFGLVDLEKFIDPFKKHQKKVPEATVSYRTSLAANLSRRSSPVKPNLPDNEQRRSSSTSSLRTTTSAPSSTRSTGVSEYSSDEDSTDSGNNSPSSERSISPLHVVLASSGSGENSPPLSDSPTQATPRDGLDFQPIYTPRGGTASTSEEVLNKLLTVPEDSQVRQPKLSKKDEKNKIDEINKKFNHTNKQIDEWKNEINRNVDVINNLTNELGNRPPSANAMKQQRDTLVELINYLNEYEKVDELHSDEKNRIESNLRSISAKYDLILSHYESEEERQNRAIEILILDAYSKKGIQTKISELQSTKARFDKLCQELNCQQIELEEHINQSKLIIKRNNESIQKFVEICLDDVSKTCNEMKILSGKSQDNINIIQNLFNAILNFEKCCVEFINHKISESYFVKVTQLVEVFELLYNTFLHLEDNQKQDQIYSNVDQKIDEVKKTEQRLCIQNLKYRLIENIINYSNIVFPKSKKFERSDGDKQNIETIISQSEELVSIISKHEKANDDIVTDKDILFKNHINDLLLLKNDNTTFFNKKLTQFEYALQRLIFDWFNQDVKKISDALGRHHPMATIPIPSLKATARYRSESCPDRRRLVRNASLPANFHSSHTQSAPDTRVEAEKKEKRKRQLTFMTPAGTSAFKKVPLLNLEKCHKDDFSLPPNANLRQREALDRARRENAALDATDLSL